LDLFSRFIVGWAVSAVNDRHVTIKALEMALKRRCPDLGLLHHSDQGCTYASEDYQDILEARGIICSMSRRGNCWDNAVMESFFSTVKSELGDRFDSHGEAKMALSTPSKCSTTRSGVIQRWARSVQPPSSVAPTKRVWTPWKTAKDAVSCVQRRLARSAGGRPARATARRPVAWIAGRRAIKELKPLDNPIERMGASHRAAAQANADVAPKCAAPKAQPVKPG
jgi:hypothetical protein